MKDELDENLGLIGEFVQASRKKLKLVITEFEKTIAEKDKTIKDLEFLLTDTEESRVALEEELKKKVN